MPTMDFSALEDGAKAAKLQHFMQKLALKAKKPGGMAIYERHIAIYQLVDDPEALSTVQFGGCSARKISCFENDFANTYFKRQFDPNFRRLCKEYEDDREGYLRKWAKLDPVWHEPVEPKKINLDTFTSIFNENWTLADVEYETFFSPRFSHYIGKSKLDELEKWAKREMLIHWPGARPENLLDGFKSVEDAMNHFVYKTPYCNHKIRSDWQDVMAGKSIRADDDTKDGHPCMSCNDMEQPAYLRSEHIKTEMMERRSRQIFLREKKETKNVKTYVTKGRAEDYDIEQVLKDLEVDILSDLSKKSKKKKKKSKKREPENFDMETVKETKTESQEDSLPECTICFCPREQTWMIDPCGHATFCEDCIGRIRKGTNRCPMCQTKITNSKRIFQ